MLRAASWSADADELPLTYSCTYFVEGSTEAPVSLTGGAYQESPVIPMQLPAGLPSAGSVVTLRLAVRSAFGAVAVSDASVIVTWPVFQDAAAVTSFVDDATARAETALQSGDSSAALQVVGGLAALLNSDSSASQSDEAATEQRTNLLSIVASAVTQGGAASIAPAALESTALLVSQLVAAPEQLSGEGAVSALAVLENIAGAGAAVTPAAAQAVASALSSVAVAPTAFSPSSGNNTSSSTYSAVLGVLDSLASSQASALAVPGQAPSTVTTPVIQMSVGLDDPTSSRLFDEPLSAPGSNSSFDPLRARPRCYGLPARADPFLRASTAADTLAAAGGLPVSSLFLSLAFDAYGNAESRNTGGITRLAFSSGATGEPVLVTNLTQPILFTMPAAVLREDEHITCAWWDEIAKQYTEDGCGQLPSPHPADHDLSFLPSFRATSPASITAAWNMTGPRMDGCEILSLDCSNITQRATGKLQLGGASTLTCSNATDVVLRAFTGPTCSLRDTKNASAPCFWSVKNQTFSGVGCVTANATRCACTHLTSFTSSPRPNLPTASLSDMISLNPADLVTKLKLLFTVVVTLFGLLHIGGIVAWVMDAREKAHVAERLRDPACGYRVTEDGVSLWRFGLDPLPDEIAAPSGPAIELAAVFGLPMARLRAAMPNELFTTDFSAALGRKHGFSASGMATTRDTHRELLTTSRRLSSGVRTPRKSSLTGDEGEGSVRAPRRSTTRFFSAASFSDDDSEPQSPTRGASKRMTDPDVPRKSSSAAAALRQSELETWNMEHRTALEEFTGTALVVAFLQVTQLLPVLEIARLRGAAAAHFEELTSPAGWSFDATATAFLTFLSPGVLNTRVNWWLRARLWKLSACPRVLAPACSMLTRVRHTVLSQSPEGWWDPTTTVAFALEARSTAETAQVKPGLLERLKDKMMGVGQLAHDLLSSDTGERVSSGAGEDSLSTHAPVRRRSSLMSLKESKNRDYLDESNDDPLWCNPRAVSASMPRRLEALRTGDASDDLQLERVWATLCCCAFLQTINVCWLATDGELCVPPEKDIAARLHVLTQA